MKKHLITVVGVIALLAIISNGALAVVQLTVGVVRQAHLQNNDLINTPNGQYRIIEYTDTLPVDMLGVDYPAYFDSPFHPPRAEDPVLQCMIEFPPELDPINHDIIPGTGAAGIFLVQIIPVFPPKGANVSQPQQGNAQHPAESAPAVK